MKPSIPPLVIKGIKTGKFHAATAAQTHHFSTKAAQTEHSKSTKALHRSTAANQENPPSTILEALNHCNRLNDWCNAEFESLSTSHEEHQAVVIRLPGEEDRAELLKMSPNYENQHPQSSSASSSEAKNVCCENDDKLKIITAEEPLLSLFQCCTIIPTTSYCYDEKPSEKPAAAAAAKAKQPVSPGKIRKRKSTISAGQGRRKRRSKIGSTAKAKPYVKSDWTPTDKGTRKLVYISNDQFPVKRVCYESIRHVKVGVELRERDCVEVFSDEATSYIGKIARLYHEPSTGQLSASVLWYYRPEQIDLEHMDRNQIKSVPTDVGNQELFSSRHFDTISVDSIQRTCFVVTFNEYVRNVKENLEDSLTPPLDEMGGQTKPRRDELIPYGDPQYPRRSRQPKDDTPEEAVYYARHLFDFASQRFIANPTAYNNGGHSKSSRDGVS